MITVYKLVIFLSTLCAIYCLNCTEKWHCLPVTTDYNFANCNQGTCECLLSFNGDATVENPCNCLSPKQVLWDSTPHCVKLEECAENTVYVDRATKLKQVVNDLYDTLIYPIPDQILGGLYSVDHLLSPNIRGRITPFGTFDSWDAVLGYWYGLSNANAKVLGHHARKITADGEIGVVSVRMDVLFNNTGFNPPRMHNITDIATFTFDENDKIVSFDTIIRDFGKSSDPPDEQKDEYIINICQLLTFTCTSYFGTTGYFTDLNDCMNFMNNTIEFGSYDRVGDTFSCRILYALMSRYYPTLNCPETGKTSGTKCVDQDYDSWYTEDY